MLNASRWQGRKFIALFLAFVLLFQTGPLTAVHAAMVTTDQVITEDAASDDRARVMEFMSRADVRQQMEALGVNPDEAAQRTAALSDAEISQIAGRIDELPAGQGVIGVVVGAILIIFLVLLITDLLGLTDVFPFVRSQR